MNISVTFVCEGTRINVYCMSTDNIASVINKYRGKAGFEQTNDLCFYFNSKELSALGDRQIGSIGINNNAVIDVVKTAQIKGA